MEDEREGTEVHRFINLREYVVGLVETKIF